MNDFQRALIKAEIAGKKNKSFFLKRIKKIEELLIIEPVADDSLHDIRKMTKDMQYVLEWRKHSVSHKKKPIKNISINTLENISKQIGQYNDTRMLLMLLGTYAQQLTDQLMINEVKPLVNKWKEMKIQHKEKLMNIMRYINWHNNYVNSI